MNNKLGIHCDCGIWVVNLDPIQNNLCDECYTKKQGKVCTREIEEKRNLKAFPFKQSKIPKIYIKN